jgi:hypothetical protein
MTADSGKDLSSSTLEVEIFVVGVEEVTVGRRTFLGLPGT